MREKTCVVSKYYCILMFSEKNSRGEGRVTGDWINVNSEQLYGWYCLLNAVRVAAVMHVICMEWE
jgi:hypothetical protein